MGDDHRDRAAAPRPPPQLVLPADGDEEKMGDDHRARAAASGRGGRRPSSPRRRRCAARAPFHYFIAQQMQQITVKKVKYTCTMCSSLQLASPLRERVGGSKN